MKYAAAKKTGGAIQYYKSPDELVERLYLPIGSKQGRKVSVNIDNEIATILDRLYQDGVIKKEDCQKLYTAYVYICIYCIHTCMYRMPYQMTLFLDYSSASGVSSNFTVYFNLPIGLGVTKTYELALISANIWYSWHNLTAKNNKFRMGLCGLI